MTLVLRYQTCKDIILNVPPISAKFFSVRKTIAMNSLHVVLVIFIAKGKNPRENWSRNFPPLLISFHLQAFSYQNPSIEIDSSGTEDKLLRPIFIPERDVKFLLFTRRNPFVGQRILLGDNRSLFESNFNFSNPTRYKRVKRKWKCSDFMTSWNLILDYSVTAGVRTWIPSFWLRVRRHFCTTVISTW